MLTYPAWWFYWLLAKWHGLVQLTRRPFCKHREWIKCDDTVDIGDNLLMDKQFEITCSRCGKTWLKTSWEIISIPLEEWD